MNENTSANPTRHFPFDTIVFDLDGTLIDSLADVTSAVNRVLADASLAPIEEELRGKLMGEGARIRMRTAFAMRGKDLTDEELDDRTRDFGRYYASCFLQETRPYAGAGDALEKLAAAGVRMAVCTNKDERSARAILAHLKLMPPIEDVAGPDTFGVQKPDPGHVLRLLERMGAVPKATILIGDSIHDVKTARAAGISVAVVDWGYSAGAVKDMGANYILRRFSDILHIGGSETKRRSA